ncbi:MAG TPA: NAD(P)-dependent oxidoreductase [Firmicutes bacterium]|jgi:NAD(P)-dependent dehydrogenase (short-subunit alcohol dehydrogenase family)|nr:NAD(P)-dependent oxidoreductase [Bacillota bacterium]
MNKNTLTGKKALIFGGAGRIGSATGKYFLEHGAEVLLADRDNLTLSNVKNNYPSYVLPRCFTATLDTQSEQLETELKVAISNTIKEVDVLINCMGYIYRAPFLEHSMDELDILWNANVKTIFRVCQLISKLMMEREKGKIINFSSVGGTRPEQNHSGYCAVKSALIAFSKVMAVELAPYNIQVNVVGPGPTETTPFTSDYYLKHPQILKALEEKTPMGRIGHPEDHLGLLLFLASDQSNWVTGQVILSDGGLSLV